MFTVDQELPGRDVKTRASEKDTERMSTKTIEPKGRGKKRWSRM